MTLVTDADIAAAQAAVDEARAAVPYRRRPLADEPFEELEAAVSANTLADFASSPAGGALRLAERKRRDLEALHARQVAAIDRHKAAETALADRLTKMTTELQASRQRLVQACSRGTLVDVGAAAREHDGLVRRLATELRRSGLPLEECEHQHDQGAIEDGAQTGLRLAGRWWLTVEPFALVMWRANAEFAALFGVDHPQIKATADRYRLRLLDLRLDGLLDGVTTPRAAQVKTVARPRVPRVTDPVVLGDPAAAFGQDAEDQAAARVPAGHRDYVRAQFRQQRQTLAAELAAAKGR